MKTLENLFIFEMANNHQGDVEHGIKIIKEMGKIAHKYNLNAGVKLQYRQLDTFIHPDFRKDKEAKHIGRFLSTELKPSQFLKLVNVIKEEGLVSICTPFDEQSVDLIEEHKIDVIKIASCSADDWPLITRIVKTNKPVIASTAGLESNQLDNLFSYLTHRLDNLAILHCVGIYPTPEEKQHLNFIEKMISRYPNTIIGYSGHEAPDNIDVIKLAVAKGAKIFERHVGIPTEKITLNKYSMNPSQVEKWIQSYFTAKRILGEYNRDLSEEERESLLSLKRGVFLKKNIKRGAFIKNEDVYFAMPCKPGQVTSGDFGKVRARFTASKDYKINEALFENSIEDTYHKTRKIIHRARAFLAENNIVLSNKYSVELNHHYGIENFEKFGCIIVNLVNREYCKKLIVVFPNQHHPEQRHIKKEETFHILAGDLNLSLNGICHKLERGDIATIERGVLHSFYSDNGAIIEEISTTHFVNDSFYTDPLIAEQDPMQRKTYIEKF